MTLLYICSSEEEKARLMATIGKLWCIKAAREAGDNVQPLEASFEMELHRIVFLIIFFLLCLQMFLAVSHFHQALAYLALLPLPPDAISEFLVCAINNIQP